MAKILHVMLKYCRSARPFCVVLNIACGAEILTKLVRGAGPWVVNLNRLIFLI